jgi:hypothetical protein
VRLKEAVDFLTKNTKYRMINKLSLSIIWKITVVDYAFATIGKPADYRCRRLSARSKEKVVRGQN